MKTRSSFRKNLIGGKLAALLLILSFQFSTFQLSAQCWQWAVRTGGTSLENPSSITVGPNGHSAITGEFMGSAIIGNDTLVATNNRDVFTAILDSNGVVLKGMGGVGDGINNISNGIASDINGNIFITGNFTGTITFDNVSLVSEGLGDVFVVKYDPSGSLLWARRGGGVDNIYANDIAVDQTGNCYIIGEFYETASFDDQNILSTISLDVFTVKYDPSGNALWAKSCGSMSSDIGSGVAVDNLSNVYITGYFQSEFIFNDIPYTSSGNRDVFVAKYNALGVPQWATVGGGSANDFFNKIAVDGNDNVFVTGEFESNSFTIDGITLQNINISPRRDILLVSFNASGDTQWGIRAGSIGHDYANDVTVDGNGDVYITGIFNDTIVFDGTTLINNSGDLYIAKYNSLGTVLWAKKPTQNNTGAESRSIVAFQNKPLITGGFPAGSGSIDVIFGHDTLISNGSLDTFVSKIGPPCSDGTTNVQDHVEKSISLTVFPNPFNELLNIKVDSKMKGLLDLKLYNLQGALIFSNKYDSNESIIIQTDHIPSGVYFLQLKNSESIQSIKIVKILE